jgi:hypothetical protein
VYNEKLSANKEFTKSLKNSNAAGDHKYLLPFLLLFHFQKAIKSKLKTVLSCFNGCNHLKKSTNQINKVFLQASCRTSLSKL